MSLAALVQNLDDDSARRLAQEILARDEYALPRQALRSLEGLLAWLRRLQDLLGWGDLIETNPVLYYVILTTLFAVAGVLLAHIVLSIRRALTWGGTTTTKAGEAAGPHFLREAEELARRGSFLEAARRLQLGVLDILLRGRLLELSRSDPNRVLRRRLAQARLPEGERRDLLRLLDRFETCWFRDREEDAQLYEGWRALYQRLTRGGAA